MDVQASVGCGIGHDMIFFDITLDCIVRLLEENAKDTTSVRLVNV